MTMYLLFDSGCATCSQIATEIETDTLGKLIHRSLQDTKIQMKLDEINPDWQWEPMLMSVDEHDKPVALFRGSKMKLQFIRLLGPSKALQL